MMKSKNNWAKGLLFVLLISWMFACNNDATVNPEIGGELDEQDGVSEEEFERNEGEIGLLVDARELARKGYTLLKPG